MTTKRSDTDFDLCQFAYSDGRYCGLPAVPGLHGYCRAHGKQPSPRPPVEYNEDISFQVPLFKNDPPTEDEVHSAIAHVFRALTCNRISTRRAATFGYLGQLMLLKKGSKEARENSNNLARMFLKSVDVAYNPKYGAPGSQAQETNSNPPQPPAAKPSNQRRS
ncbi:MAG TPA: hypothetical protein VJX70_07865 [Candidatus Acidoferrum sp.]|nr:hypothetical protein [Candidatus Acidoferrum sp.]